MTVAAKTGRLRRASDGPWQTGPGSVAVYAAVSTIGLKREYIGALVSEAALGVEEQLREMLEAAVDQAAEAT